MKTLTGALVALVGAALIGSLGGNSQANAEEYSSAELMRRIQSLESQLNRQNQLISYSNIQSSEVDCGTCDGCGSMSDCSCGCSTLFAGYEVTALRPYVSNTNLGPGYGKSFGYGHRLFLGIDGSNGFGLRGRYWFYNHGHAFIPAVRNPLQIDLDVLDLEATLSQRLSNWDLTVAGGVRYGRLGYQFDQRDGYFEGVGPTVALEGSRELGDRGFYVLGNFRASLLMGDIIDPTQYLGSRPIIRDELMTVLETQLGIGWARQYNIGELHFRGLWETQGWLNNTIANGLSDLALSGPTFTVELRR